MAAGAGGAGSPPWGGARGPPPSSSLVFPPRAGPVGVSVHCGAGVWGGVACCRVLGRCALVSGPLGPPPVFLGGSGVVGGLVVNCIVDASICGRPRYRELCCWSPVCLFSCLVRRAARAGVVRVARAPCVVLCCVLFVFMSVRWMPWHRGPMKDAVACDIPRGAGLRAVIRGFPNGGTRRPSWGVTRV